MTVINQLKINDFETEKNEPRNHQHTILRKKIEIKNNTEIPY